MKEIILEKRYPHSREEDITDAFMRGYKIGKEQEHRWWSNFCANCKTEPNSSENPNNSQTCANCKFDHEEWFEEACDSCCDAHSNWQPKTEPQTIAEDINRRVEMGKKEWNARHIETEPQTERSE